MNFYSIKLLGLITTFLFACTPTGSLEKDKKPEDIEPGLPKIYLTGSKADKKTNHKAGILLAGGGSDVDEAMKWMLLNADGGDIVVLRASGSDAYNNYLFSSLGVSVNSVRTLVIDTRDKADKDSVDKHIRNAEALFIAGGDQSVYLRIWSGTRVESALKYLIDEKRVTIGGTSAGMAILSEFSYTGEMGSATSAESLIDPYNNRVTISKSFIKLPVLKKFITDTHFSQRERFGRVVVFIARIAKEYTILPKAIACDEYSAICVDNMGVASIYGEKAFFIEAVDTTSFNCLAREPLSWDSPSGALRYMEVRGDLSGESKFDISNWSSKELEWAYINIWNGTIEEL